MLIDTHCHLDFPDFAPELAETIARAKARGVARMITISTHLSRFDRVKAVAETYPEVFCTVGTHPHHSHEEAEPTVEALASLSKHPKCVGLGEAGLDYHYDNSPRDIQKKSFRIHIAAARETGLPLIIHARDADADIARMLEEETAKGAFPFVLHCFTGGPDLARRGLALGGSISFSGVITFKNAEPLRDIALAVPSDRLLVETDAPYLAPEPMRGKTNEPAFVVHTAARLAALRGVRETEMARMTTENFFRLFRKVPRSSLKSPQSAA